MRLAGWLIKIGVWIYWHPAGFQSSKPTTIIYVFGDVLWVTAPAPGVLLRTVFRKKAFMGEAKYRGVAETPDGTGTGEG